MPTTYAFSWRGGAPVPSDAATTYQGTRFDIDAFMAGGGVTTDDALAALLRGVPREDGLSLLTEVGTPGGTAPDRRGSVPAFVQRDAPAAAPYLHIKTNGSGVPTGEVVVNDGTNGERPVGAPQVSMIQAQQVRTLADLSLAGASATPPPFEKATTVGFNPIIVRPDETFQEFLGCGGALTDSTAYLLYNNMTPSQRTALLAELFSPAQANWSTVRIPFGLSDFRRQAAYTYDDNGGSADPTLAAFSLGADRDYIIPVLKEILAINPKVRVIGSVWYPPAWMKTAIVAPTAPSATPSGSGGTLAAATYYYKIAATYSSGAESVTAAEVNSGALTGSTSSVTLNWTAAAGATGYKIYRGTAAGAENVFYTVGAVTTFTDTGAASTGGSPPTSNLASGEMPSANYAVYASYLVKAIQAFEALGIPIYGITPANEWTGGYTRFSPAQMAAVIPVIGAAFDAAALETKIIIHDDNWAGAASVLTVLADAAANAYVDSIGWHSYSGSPTAQTTIRRAYPSKGHHITEMRTLVAEDGPASLGIMGAGIAVGSVRNWGKSITLWNIALDENGGPQTTGVGGRRGVVTVNSTTAAVTRNLEYWCLTHLSKFLQPGARRCTSTTEGVGKNSATVQTVAFVNPDQSVVLVVVNLTATKQTRRIVEGRNGGSFPVTLAPYELSTFVWGTTVQATPAGTADKLPTIASTSSGMVAANATSLTFKHTVASGLAKPVLVVALASGTGGAQNEPTYSSVKFGGVDLVQLGRATGAGTGTNRTVELWALVNPAVGGKDIVATVASGTVPIVAEALTIEGVAQSGSFGAPASDAGNKNNPATSLTGGAAGDLVISAVSLRANQVPIPSSEQQVIADLLFGSNFHLSVSVQRGGTGTIASSFSWTTADFAAMLSVPVHAA